MASIIDKINSIRQAVFGKDVRESIASGIEAINTEVESTTDRQNDLEATFGQLIINAGSDNAQIVAATHDIITGEIFDTIGERLDSHSSLLLEKAKQVDLQTEKTRIDNLVANAGNTDNNAELLDIRVDAQSNTYSTASNAMKSISKGATPKVVLSEIAATVYSGSANTITNTYFFDDTRAIGIKSVINLADTQYVYSAARLTTDKVYNDLKTKKFKFVIKSKTGTPITTIFKLTNGGSWGSGDNTIGTSYSETVTLDSSNDYTKVITIDLSESAYQTFYAASQRQVTYCQKVCYILSVNDTVDIANGSYTLYSYVYEVNSEDEFNRKHVPISTPHGHKSIEITDATKLNTPNTIIKRDGNGDFNAGTMNGNVVGNVTGNLTGNVTGNLTGTAKYTTNAGATIKTPLTVEYGVSTGVNNGGVNWTPDICTVNADSTFELKFDVGDTNAWYIMNKTPLGTKADLLNKKVLLILKQYDTSGTALTPTFAVNQTGQWAPSSYWMDFTLGSGYCEALGNGMYLIDIYGLISTNANYIDTSPVNLCMRVYNGNVSGTVSSSSNSCHIRYLCGVTNSAESFNYIIANGLTGFNKNDYLTKVEYEESQDNMVTGDLLSIIAYGGTFAACNVFAKTVNGITTTVTRAEVANPSLLWNHVLISVDLGTVAQIQNKKFYIHFNMEDSPLQFKTYPLISKSSSNWSTAISLPNYDTSQHYNVYDDIYEKVTTDGRWISTDHVYIVFWMDQAANSGPTTIPAIDINICGISVDTVNDINNRFVIANAVNGFDPVEYAKTSDIESVVNGIIDSSKYITCWGDSLTAGGGWTSTLSSLSGLTVNNGGTGGENVRTITARQGADVMLINNITIPADTSTITLKTYSDGGFDTSFGYKATPLLQGGAHVNPVMIGDVEGTLSWTGSSYNDAAGTWTFKRTTAGEAVTINRPTAIRTDFDRNKNSGIMIVFMGQNGGYTDNADLINMHNLMRVHNGAKHMIVLGLSSGTAAERATYESDMKKAFGRYFISLREYLSVYGMDDAGLTPTQADLDAMALGKTPPSLLSDTVHYNTTCKTVIGNMLYKKMKELNIF